MDDYELALSLLGVDQSSSEEEIKKAYRRLALIYHPDHKDSENAEEQLRAIHDAYEILKGYVPVEPSSIVPHWMEQERKRELIFNRLEVM